MTFYAYFSDDFKPKHLPEKIFFLEKFVDNIFFLVELFLIFL